MLASSLKTCTIWAPSISLASASSKSDGQSTSNQDNKSDFWPLLTTPCLDRDSGQSTFSTSNRRSLFPSLTCTVTYSFPIIGAVHMLAFVAVFVSIAGEVDFVHLDWRVECDCCRLQAMRLMHSCLP